MKFTLEIPDNSKAISLSIVRQDESGNLILTGTTFDVTEADGKRIVVPEESGELVKMYD